MHVSNKPEVLKQAKDIPISAVAFIEASTCPDEPAKAYDVLHPDPLVLGHRDKHPNGPVWVGLLLRVAFRGREVPATHPACHRRRCVRELEPLAPEVFPRRRPDKPVPISELRARDVIQTVELGHVLVVNPRVVADAGRDEDARERARRA